LRGTPSKENMTYKSGTTKSKKRERKSEEGVTGYFRLLELQLKRSVSETLCAARTKYNLIMIVLFECPIISAGATGPILSVATSDCSSGYGSLRSVKV